MLKLILVVCFYSQVLFHGTTSTPSLETTDTPSSSRTKLITSIIKNLGTSNTEYYQLMPSFATQHGLNTETNYGITSFRNILKLADPTVRPIHTDIIYAYFSNYQVQVRRKESYESLTAITDITGGLNIYKQQMANFISHFYFDDYATLNENDFKYLISKRLPEIRMDNIPSSLYQQYVTYMDNKMYVKSRDDLLEEINKIPKTNIDKFEDLISKFEQSYKIGTTFNGISNFEEHVKNLLPTFDTPVGSIQSIWVTYEKYYKYLNCVLKRNIAVNLFGTGDKNSPYYAIKSAMMDFRIKCELTSTYNDATSFWEAIKQIDPTIEERKAKFLFYYYKIFLALLDKELVTTYLINAIKLKKTINTKNIDRELSEFKTVFDLPIETLKEDDLNRYLSEIKTSESEVINGADILTEYNLYVERENPKDKTIKLHSAITAKLNIKSHELKTEMEAFIKACKFTVQQKFDKNNPFLDYVKRVYPGFDAEQSALIEPKYNEFLDYQLRIQNRDSMLKLLKGKEKFSIRQNLGLLNTFKDLHFLSDTEVPEFETFKDHLKDMDNVHEDDSILLYLIYPNYVVYKNKEKARENLLKLHNTNDETYIYTLRVQALKFIEEHNFDLDKTLDETDFYKYLTDQDIEIIDTTVRNALYLRYEQYLRYNRMVENRNKVISMITNDRKLSEMKSTIKVVVDNMAIIQKEVNDKERLKMFVKNRDPEIPIESLDGYIQKIHEYFELIERLSKKESLLEYVSLNPKPKSVDLETLMRPFILDFNFGYQEFTNPTSFHAHLKTQQDDISEEESKILFKYYQIFTMMENRWNIRNNLFEFLEKELHPSISKMFPLVELLVSAYGITQNSFSSIEEFRHIVQIIDDTFDEKYVNRIYDPLVRYLQFVARVSKRKTLMDFKTRRTDASVYQLDDYVQPVVKSYYISYDILSDFEIFTNHVNELDYTMSHDEIENIYNTISNHLLIMDRIKIKDTSLETIKHHSFGDDNSNVNNMMILLVDIYQIAGKKITDAESLFQKLSEKDPTASKEEAKIIYPHYVIYVQLAHRRIIRFSLLGYIRNIPNPTYKELWLYMNPYIKSHNILIPELYNIERFKLKNKAMDNSITDEEIKSLWRTVEMFIKNEEFINDQTSVLSHNDVIYHKDFIKPGGFGGLVYEIFKYFGAYPHYIPIEMSLRELSNDQKRFENVYKLLTGIEYFRVRPEKPLSKTSLQNSN